MPTHSAQLNGQRNAAATQTETGAAFPQLHPGQGCATTDRAAAEEVKFTAGTDRRVFRPHCDVWQRNVNDAECGSG
jgi:hypothetical protein